MREVSWSLAGLFLLSTACGHSDPIGSDAIDQNNGNASANEKDGGKSGSKDAGKDAGKSSARTDAGGTIDDNGCERISTTTGSVIPDMLIVLDRSGSMKPGIGAAPSLRCDGTPDPITKGICELAGIDCADPSFASTSFCGGMSGPVDRWTPSVSAIKSLTAKFDQSVEFGLMTFPPSSDRCGPGDLQVPLGLGVAAKIASVLDGTSPGGGTPTGQTLQAALELFQASVAADSVAPAQYVLLVTDGQPTCPNSNGSSNDPSRLQKDKQLTLDELDKLAKAGIKTFVVGYDAALDKTLAQSLTEFAQHGGTDDYYPVQNEDSLVDAFNKISQVVATCAFTFKSEIQDPSRLHVTLDGVTLKPNDPNGWVLDGQTVTVQGDSCKALQEEGEKHHIEIAQECYEVVY